MCILKIKDNVIDTMTGSCMYSLLQAKNNTVEFPQILLTNDHLLIYFRSTYREILQEIKLIPQ